MATSIIFGPVPSRRLGRSLGINNIPPKICSYSCLYCQLGRTEDKRAKRESFFKAEEVALSVQRRVEEVKRKGEGIDYLTFVPDGEPTLDINLGREIELLKPLGVKIAVISNASLLWCEDVRQDLLQADLVSLKVDTINEEVWRQINRPHSSLEFGKVIEGITRFASAFKGELVTESMLIKDINDDRKEIERLAFFLKGLKPRKAYLAIPTRPPAERAISPASKQTVTMAYQIFSAKLEKVECLVGYEGSAFTSTGDAEDDLLSITAVHPMRQDAVTSLLKRAGSSWGVVEKLMEEGRLVEVEYEGKKFYMRGR